MTADKTFIRITNLMIYQKLEAIEKRMHRLDGSVLWHSWAIGALLLITCALITAAFIR